MTDDRKLPNDLYDTEKWHEARLALRAERLGIPLDELRAAQEAAVAEHAARQAEWEASPGYADLQQMRARQAEWKAKLQAKEEQRLAEEQARREVGFEKLVFQSAAEVLDVLDGLPTQTPENASPFAASFPAASGAHLNELFTEWAQHEARITAIRDAIADQLAPRVGREYARTRPRESLQSDAAVLALMRYLALHGRARYWSGTLDTINRGHFGWKPSPGAQPIPANMRE